MYFNVYKESCLQYLLALLFVEIPFFKNGMNSGTPLERPPKWHLPLEKPQSKFKHECINYYPCLVGCVLRPINSKVILRRHPYLLSLAKDAKLGFYTVSTGNRTPGCRVAVQSGGHPS